MKQNVLWLILACAAMLACDEIYREDPEARYCRIEPNEPFILVGVSEGVCENVVAVNEYERSDRSSMVVGHCFWSEDSCSCRLDLSSAPSDAKDPLGYLDSVVRYYVRKGSKLRGPIRETPFFKYEHPIVKGGGQQSCPLVSTEKVRVDVDLGALGGAGGVTSLGGQGAL